MTLHLAKEDVGAGSAPAETKAIALPGEGEDEPMALTAPPEDWRPAVEGGVAQSLRERVNRAGAAVWASFGRSSAAPSGASDGTDDGAAAAAVENDGDRGPGAAGAPAEPAWKKRAALFAGASLIALLAFGAFVLAPILVSGRQTGRSQVAETGVGAANPAPQPLIAPSADLARVGRPEGSGEAVSKPPPAGSGPDQLDEILALKAPEKGVTPAPASAPAAEAGAASTAPTSATPAPRNVAPPTTTPGQAAGAENEARADLHDAGDKVVGSPKESEPEKPVAEAARSGAAAQPAHEPAPAAADRPSAPAVDVRVASVGREEGTRTAASDPAAAKAAAADDGKNERTALALVTELGALLHDVRAEVAGLKAAQHASAEATEARLSDFERRLSLGEARRAIDSAKAVGSDPADETASIALNASLPASKPAGAPGKAQKANGAKTTVATAPEPDARKRYRVQAASPTLAMLAEIDRTGDDGAPLQIGIGADVPGYGKVKSIAQRGTSWVVETESGSIQ